MAYAKVISTTFGVTIAVVHSGSIANDLDINTYLNNNTTAPYSGNIYNLPSTEMTAMDLYHAIFPPNHDNSENTEDTPFVTIYKHENGRKQAVTGESIVISPEHSILDDIQIFSFAIQETFSNDKNFHSNIDQESKNPFSEFSTQDGANVGFHQGTSHYVHPFQQQTGFRIGALISGGPDGIMAASLMQEAGNLERRPIEGYDFFYIKSGRPSDWQELNSIEHYLQNNFNDNYQMHIIDMSLDGVRTILCGEYEETYTRFGLSIALSLVYAKCEKLINKPDFILFGIHGADASFKAKQSNEYTRHFVNKWNSFWKSFYPSRPFLIAPFIDVFDKIDILKMAKPLGVDIEKTWSCYKGGEYHCGECKSCLERRLAYKIARKPDPTQYANVPDIKQFQDRIGGVSINKHKQQIQLSS